MKIQPIATMFLWVIPLVLQASVALAMIVRKQIRTFPVFFCYTLFVPFRDLILLFIRGDLALYSLIYWIGDGITIGLGMAIIYEVLWHLIRPYPLLSLVGQRIFWITLVLACGAGILILVTSRAKEPRMSIQLVLLAELLARFVQVGMLIIFIALISFFDLKWRHYTAGIVSGFGIAAGLQLGLYEIKAHLHEMSDATFRILAPAAYNCAVIIWALYFLPGHRETKAETVPAVDFSKLDRILAEFTSK